jgi:hypothetical protein
MDGCDRHSNLEKKNLADIVAIYGRGRELFIPPTYTVLVKGSATILKLTLWYHLVHELCPLLYVERNNKKKIRIFVLLFVTISI